MSDEKKVTEVVKETVPKVETKVAPEKKAPVSDVEKSSAKGPVERKVGTNPLALPFPSDPQGALSALKKGGITAARRVNGDKAKLKRLIETLEIISEHAKARYVKDVKARETAKVNHVSAKARIAEKQRREAEAKAKEYEAAAARVRAVAGIEAEKED